MPTILKSLEFRWRRALLAAGHRPFAGRSTSSPQDLVRLPHRARILVIRLERIGDVLVGVPVLRALRAELGKERADAIVKDALRDWSKALFAAVGESVEGSPRRKWAAMHTALAEVTEREVTVEMIRHDKEALEFDVSHCRFAEFFRALGEPELGALLVCATDFDIVAAGGSEVDLTRDQTLMQGAPSCTFRYRFAPRA